MENISQQLEKIVHILKNRKIDYLEFYYTNNENEDFIKIKIINEKSQIIKNQSVKVNEKGNFLHPNQSQNSYSKITENSYESYESYESEDLGGFKIKFIDQNKFYLFSTLVGKLNFNEEIKIGKVIKPKQKIGEIEILNIKNPISLDFEYKIIEILINKNEKVDYGKNIILAEKLKNGNS